MRTLLPFVILSLLPLGSSSAGERFACNAKALSEAERSRYQELSQALFAAVQERRELPDGYGFRVSAAEWLRAGEWVSLERRCCPFFTFALEQTRDGGPVWLRVTGPAGVKAFLREELGL